MQMVLYVFLLLPLFTTLLNLGLAVILLTSFGDSVTAQDAKFVVGKWITQDTPLDDSLLIGDQGEDETNNSLRQNCMAVDGAADDEEEDDPMLQYGLELDPDFKAYVRADISSFYREATGSRAETTPRFKGHAAKFINMSPEYLKLYWEDNANRGHFNGYIRPFTSGGTASFPGHKFYFARRSSEEIVCRFIIEKGTSVYYYDPFQPLDQPSHYSAIRGTMSADQLRSLDDLSEESKRQYASHVFNLEFGTQYKNFTGGSEWLSMYPRDRPLHKIWRADYFGQTHVVETRETHFFQAPPEDTYTVNEYDLTWRSSGDSAVAYTEYRIPGTMNLTIEAVSCAPRVFQIENFLSETEVDHVLDLVLRRTLRRSTTSSSAHQDESEPTTRTSRNTWIPRTASPILDAIYARVADVLRLDESLLRHTTTRPINEDMQIVHYDVGQEYTPHHDFGYPDNKPNFPSRSINLCLYLNEGMGGGKTSFPRWRNAETRDGLTITPQKGKAVIFYMINPDGNLDDLTQHAGLPVLKGQKWFANLWIWDPARSR